MKTLEGIKKYAGSGQRIAQHIPTGLYCAVMSDNGEKCFCNFGAIANPFVRVKSAELKPIAA